MRATVGMFWNVGVRMRTRTGTSYFRPLGLKAFQLIFASKAPFLSAKSKGDVTLTNGNSMMSISSMSDAPISFPLKTRLMEVRTFVKMSALCAYESASSSNCISPETPRTLFCWYCLVATDWPYVSLL